MKFRVESSNNSNFKYRFSLEDSYNGVYFKSNETLDEFIMKFQDPIIQIFPSGKEKVILGVVG